MDKFVISKELVLLKKQELVSKYSCRVFELYRRGVLSHPAVLNSNEIRDYSLRGGIDLFSRLGIYDLSKSNLIRAKVKERVRGRTEYNWFLDLLIEIRDLRFRITELDKFWSNNKMWEAPAEKGFKSNVLVGSGSPKATGLKLTQDLAECISGIDWYNNELTLDPVSSVYRNILTRDPEAGPGAIIAGATPEEEIQMLAGIFTGVLELDGTHVEHLKEIQDANSGNQISLLEYYKEREIFSMRKLFEEKYESLSAKTGTGFSVKTVRGILRQRKRTSREIVLSPFKYLVQKEEFYHLPLHPTGWSLTGEYVPSISKGVPLEINGEKVSHSELSRESYSYVSPFYNGSASLVFENQGGLGNEYSGHDLSDFLVSSVNEMESGGKCSSNVSMEILPETEEEFLAEMATISEKVRDI